MAGHKVVWDDRGRKVLPSVPEHFMDTGGHRSSPSQGRTKFSRSHEMVTVGWWEDNPQLETGGHAPTGDGDGQPRRRRQQQKGDPAG